MITDLTLPDLLDNSSGERKMTNALNTLLQSGPDVRIATGFFNLGGYTLIRDGLAQAKTVRILLGKEPTAVAAGMAAQTPTQQDQGIDVQAITDEIIGDVGAALSTGRREVNEDIQHFLDFLRRESVKFRLYRRRFFHAKAYIFEGVPPFGTVAVTGSSNFTAAGLTSNTELNMVQKQAAIADEVTQWFNSFWDNEEDSIDYKPKLIELYSDATALHPPYLIYMKSLWEALHDKLGGDLLPLESSRPSPIMLADFQHDGYIVAKDILETYNGVVIADPVGFGKTYLALRLLDDYAYHLRQKVLIICPAQLRDVWWEPKLGAYRIYANIQSQERVSQSDFPVEEFADHDLIVIDECHNFRNPNANRWQNLARLLTTGKPKKLILLTATPINTSLFDLYHQLRLLTKDRDDYFVGVGIASLFRYFRQAEGEREGLHNLLEAIAVRRSRDFIRRNYPEAQIDGQAVHFPERRLHTTGYSLEKTCNGLYAEVVQVIENLHLAPYLLDSYKSGVPHSLRGSLIGESKVAGFHTVSPELAMALGRQMALVGLLKMLYLKRLESSVYAFKISLDRACHFQQRFLEQLKDGKLLSPEAFHRTETLLRGLEDTDDLSEITRAEKEARVEATIEEILTSLDPVDATGYDVAAIEVAVEYDVHALEEISRKLEPLTQAQDDKLATLKHLLTGELRDHKVIVFSYFRDTTRYLWRTLSRDMGFQQDMGHTQISFAHSSLDPRERRDRITRFAPKANNRPDIVGTPDEIQLLFSTDILSEGQNLQDANVLINYDLHWNPVRMVQRAGRIDRLGSDFESIHLYNFIPEDTLESLIAIVQRLRDRLEAINRAGLLDAPVMGEAPTPQDFNALRRIADADGSVLSELERFSDLDTGEFLKEELLNFLKYVGEEKLRELLPGVGTGKRSANRQRGLYVHLRAGAQHFQLFYDLATGRWEDRRLESIKLARCAENEPAVSPDFDIYPIIESAKKYVANYLRQARFKLPRLVPPQNHIVIWLKSRDARNPVVRELREYFSTPLPNPQLRRLRRLWNQHRADPRTLLEALQVFACDNPVLRTERPDVMELSEEDLRVVCYLALV